MANCIILVDKWEGFTEKYLCGLAGSLKKDFSISIYFIPDKKFELNGVTSIYAQKSSYFAKTSNPALYDEFFMYIQENEFDQIIIPRLSLLEYFVLDLMSQKNKSLPPISLGFYGYNELTSSERRLFVINEFLNSSEKNRIVLHSNGWNSKVIDLSLVELVNARRIIPIADPIYEKPSLYRDKSSLEARSALGIAENLTVILFFGSMFFGKGLDILLDAFDLLPENYFLLIASSSTTLNMDMDKKRLVGDRKKHLDAFIEESEVPTIFSASDIVCMPYRASYLDGTSGVLVQSALSGKPICVPDIAPFNEIVSDFLVGSSFIPCDSTALANALKEIDITGNLIDYSSNWQRYIKTISSWGEIAASYASNKDNFEG